MYTDNGASNAASRMNKLHSPFASMISLIISLLIFTVYASDASKHLPIDSASNTIKHDTNVLADSPIIIGGEGPVDPTLPRNYVRSFKQQNPNVISIGAVLESQEAIAHFLQVSR